MVLAAEGIARVRTYDTKSRRIGGMILMKGAALLGRRITKLRHISSIFPFQVCGQIRERFPLEELRLGFPKRLHLGGVVVGRKTIVRGLGTAHEPGRRQHGHERREDALEMMWLKGLHW